MTRLGSPVEGVHLLQRAENKCPPITVACALVEPTSSTIPVRVLNPLTESVVLYAGTTIAALESIDPPPGEVSVVSSSTGSMKDTNKEELLWTLVEQTGEGLSTDLKNMFSSYSYPMLMCLPVRWMTLGRQAPTLYSHRGCHFH